MADSDASSGSSSSSSSDSVLIRVPLDQKRRKKLRAQLQEDQRRQRERQSSISTSSSLKTVKSEPDSDRGKGEHICVVCEREGDDLVVCAGPCISAFHLSCLPPSSGAAEASDEAWLCPSCKSKTHACFHCKQTGIETLKDDAPASTSTDPNKRPVRKCRALSCGKFYHQECITQFPLARIAINTHFICPLHTCAGCNQSGAQQEAVRCMRCPVAYHAKCLPSNCVRQISSKLIICPKHGDIKPKTAVSKQLSEVQAQEENEDDVMSEASASSTKRKEKKEKKEKRDKKKKKKKKKKDKHKRDSLASHADDEQEHDDNGKKRKRATGGGIGKSDDDSDASTASPLKKKRSSSEMSAKSDGAEQTVKEERPVEQKEGQEQTSSPVPSSPIPASPSADNDSVEARSSAEEDTPDRKQQRHDSHDSSERGEQRPSIDGDLKLEIPKSPSASVLIPSSTVGSLMLKHVPSEDEDEDEEATAESNADATPRTLKNGRGYGKKKRKNKAKREARTLKRETSEEEEEEVNEAKWVQCDSCKKWRTVPRDFNLDAMPKHWYCKMNTSGGSLKGSVTDMTALEDKDKHSRKHKDKTSKKRKMTKQLKEKYREVKWVQCESTQCGKWRVVPASINFDRLPAVWYCSLNTWAPELAKCSAPNPPEVDTFLLKQNKKEGRPSKKARASSSSIDATPTASVSVALSGGMTPTSSTNDLTKLKHGKSSTKLTGNPAASGGNTDASSNNGDGKGRGRTSSGIKKTVLEWAQCEKCNKWRKLPQHIKSSTLPDKWYCSMNHWDPSHAKCSVPEEADQEPLPLPPHPGSQWHKGGHKGQRTKRGKLSYSELLYGSTGQLRKAYTRESSTLSFEYEGVTYHRDDQYKHSSMYVSPAAMAAAATMAGWSGSDRVNRETSCKNDAKVDALAAATPPQASVEQVAALVLENMDLRRRRSVSELFDAVNSAQRGSETTGLASLAVVTAALGQLEHRGLVEKVDEFSDEEEPHKRQRLDSLFNGAFSVPTHYRKVPTRPLKASKCWKFGNVVALSSVKD
ncbi:Sec14 cytosolic factor [Phytophthora nicotianae]|uniref:Sec14 cytosolic factor n=1 Tax=Phytophthora nicotianae TaxID=4792 RepID=A0A0W8D021_PHYNI|nr:Sec14 cytosolic factor [Phytophthora nicotianae]